MGEWSLVTCLRPNGLDICVEMVGRVDAAIYVDCPSLRSRSGKNGSAHGRGRCSCSASGFQATWGKCAQPPPTASKPQRTYTQPHYEYQESLYLLPSPLFGIFCERSVQIPTSATNPTWHQNCNQRKLALQRKSIHSTHISLTT
jgi:hypothetical protein